MDTKNNKNRKNKSQETDFNFPLGNFQKMADMMRSCCNGKGRVTDCCSLMKEMTGFVKNREAQRENKTEKP